MNQRSADRLLNGALANGGLYIKIGQGVAAINHILPKEYTSTLKKLEVDYFQDNLTFLGVKKRSLKKSQHLERMFAAQGERNKANVC